MSCIDGQARVEVPHDATASNLSVDICEMPHLKRPWMAMRLRRRLPFHMSAGAVGRSRTQIAADPTKLSVSNWIGLRVGSIAAVCLCNIGMSAKQGLRWTYGYAIPSFHDERKADKVLHHPSKGAGSRWTMTQVSGHLIVQEHHRYG
jgi:hypothetical protein